MKNTKSIYTIACILTVILLANTAVLAASKNKKSANKNAYIVIGWNDLGMHCISPSFEEMAILPPYNTLVAQVIKKGNPPSIVTSGVTLEYSIVNNTNVSGKTDFWIYAQQLFGVSLPEGIGLTGNGLSGTMQLEGDRFTATGIPVLPYYDNMIWNPYQVAVITLKDTAGKELDKINVVIPVSDEMNCKTCHISGGVAAVDINTGTVEGNILTLHDIREGTDLMSARPVLCSGCHPDNALGATGTPNTQSLSQAMHAKHAYLGTVMPVCYDCHPGTYTQCNRSAIEGMGPQGSDPKCESCHSSLQQMANSLIMGREPWLQEPTCIQCHGGSFVTDQSLYRNSTGHGGLACPACHNSPHAWWPSMKKADNLQPLNLQGSNDPIGEKCKTCHKKKPKGGDIHKE